VVEKLLAVVREKHDESPVVDAPGLELADKTAELPVAVSDFSVVLRDDPIAVQRLPVVGRFGRGTPRGRGWPEP
jgi:hypothetical protein